MVRKHSQSIAGFFVRLFVVLTLLSSLSNIAWADHRVRPLASDLSARADHVWGAAQNRLQERYYQGSDGENAMILYMALANFAHSARLYKNFADSFADENLRGGAKSLLQQGEYVDRLMDRAGVFGHLRDDWRQVQSRLGALAAEFRLDSAFTRYHDRRSDEDLRQGDRSRRDRHDDGPSGPVVHGSFRWRGEVDGEDLIRIRGREVWVDHISASPIVNASYDMTAPLPRQPVSVEFKKHRGRGRIELIERPSAQNDFTATVRIQDDDSGRDRYEFELKW